jgi:GNAT superfamily N-acetyltransferase
MQMELSQKSDGVVIRRVVPADAGALRDFYAALSADSRRARFLGCVSGLSNEQSRSFCTPDHMHAEGFVAVPAGQPLQGKILGHLCLEPAERDSLELAVAVADAAQGRGIGRALFTAALDWAASRGFQSVCASCLADNSRVLSLLSSAPGQPRITAADAGVVDVQVPLRPALPPAWSAAEPTAHRRRRRASPVGQCRIVWRPAYQPAADSMP